MQKVVRDWEFPFTESREGHQEETNMSPSPPPPNWLGCANSWPPGLQWDGVECSQRVLGRTLGCLDVWRNPGTVAKPWPGEV